MDGRKSGLANDVVSSGRQFIEIHILNLVNSFLCRRMESADLFGYYRFGELAHSDGQKEDRGRWPGNRWRWIMTAATSKKCFNDQYVR